MLINRRIHVLLDHAVVHAGSGVLRAAGLLLGLCCGTACRKGLQDMLVLQQHCC